MGAKKFMLKMFIVFSLKLPGLPAISPATSPELFSLSQSPPELISLPRIDQTQEGQKPAALFQQFGRLGHSSLV